MSKIFEVDYDVILFHLRNKQIGLTYDLRDWTILSRKTQKLSDKSRGSFKLNKRFTRILHMCVPHKQRIFPSVCHYCRKYIQYDFNHKNKTY